MGDGFYVSEYEKSKNPGLWDGDMFFTYTYFDVKCIFTMQRRPYGKVQYIQHSFLSVNAFCCT